MPRRLLLLLGALLVTSLLTGCGDAYPIEDLGFVSMLGLDGAEGRIRMAAQIVNPTALPGSGTGGPAQGQSIQIVQATGPNLAEAVRQADQRSPKRLFFGQLETVVVTDRLVASGGLGGVLDYLERGLRSRDIPWIFLSRASDFEKLMAVAPPLETYPARALVSQSVAARANSVIRPARVYEVATDTFASGRNPVLPVITARGQAFVLTTLALLRGDHLAGTFSFDAAKGYMWLTGQAAVAPLAIPCSGRGSLGAEAYQPVRRFRTVLDKSGRLKGFDVRIESRIHLNLASGCRIDWHNATDQTAVMQRASQVVLRSVTAALTEAKAAHSDVFGLGAYLRAHQPSLWDQLRPRWDDEVFPVLPVAVQITFKPDNSGLLRGSDEVR